MRIECCEVGFEAADSGSEHVRATASDNPPNRHPRQAKLADDLLYRNPLARQSEDRFCRFLAALKPLPLPTLRFRQN